MTSVRMVRTSVGGGGERGGPGGIAGGAGGDQGGDDGGDEGGVGGAEGGGDGDAEGGGAEGGGGQLNATIPSCSTNHLALVELSPSLRTEGVSTEHSLAE